MKPRNRTIDGLRDILWEQIEKVQNKQCDREQAALVVKAADSIISTFKVELAHAALFKKTEPIAALESKKTVEVEPVQPQDQQGEPAEEPQADAQATAE